MPNPINPPLSNKELLENLIGDCYKVDGPTFTKSLEIIEKAKFKLDELSKPPDRDEIQGLGLYTDVAQMLYLNMYTAFRKATGPVDMVLKLANGLLPESSPFLITSVDADVLRNALKGGHDYKFYPPREDETLPFLLSRSVVTNHDLLESMLKKDSEISELKRSLENATEKIDRLEKIVTGHENLCVVLTHKYDLLGTSILLQHNTIDNIERDVEEIQNDVDSLFQTVKKAKVEAPEESSQNQQ
jgi:hypothetical protein